MTLKLKTVSRSASSADVEENKSYQIPDSVKIGYLVEYFVRYCLSVCSRQDIYSVQY